MHIEEFVARRVAELCQKQHLTMYRLAQLSGVKQSTISNILNQKTLPNIVTLEKLCNSFGITLSQFFQEDDACTATLTEEQKQILDIWITLNKENKNLIKTILQGMKDNAGIG